jgi:hypothetical protein
VRVTLLSQDLSTNAGRRTHRLAGAVATFADVELIGPASRSHRWLELPDQPWIHTVRKRRWPGFHASFEELVEAADGENARARCLERYSFERIGEQLAGIVGAVARPLAGAEAAR